MGCASKLIPNAVSRETWRDDNFGSVWSRTTRENGKNQDWSISLDVRPLLDLCLYDGRAVFFSNVDHDTFSQLPKVNKEIRTTKLQLAVSEYYWLSGIRTQVWFSHMWNSHGLSECHFDAMVGWLKSFGVKTNGYTDIREMRSRVDGRIINALHDTWSIVYANAMTA